MINIIYKDYTEKELNQFKEQDTLRYNKLKDILNIYKKALRYVDVAITLPFLNDKGCVIVTKMIDINNSKNILILNTHYF